MGNAYLGDFFDGIPAILFQARWHINDADFEVIQRIHRRLGLLNYLVSSSRPQSIDYTLYIFVRKIHVLGNNSSSKRNRILSNQTVSIKCRLHIGYKMKTRYKMQTDAKTIAVKYTIIFFLTYANVTQSPFRDQPNQFGSIC